MVQAQKEYCDGQHRFFVAESFANETDGSIGIILVCTACGEGLLKRFDVGKGPTSIERLDK